MLEHEVIIAIKTYLSSRLEIFHLHSHQDKILIKGHLSLPQKLNQLTDNVIKSARTPLNVHIPFTPLEVCVDHQCIVNKYTYHI